MVFVKGQSGNPKGRPNRKNAHARPIAQAEKRIADRLPSLIDKMFELAEGVMVEEQTMAGAVVYQRPPDRTAIQYLADRIMGKPTEKLDAEVHGSFEVVKALDSAAWESV